MIGILVTTIGYIDVMGELKAYVGLTYFINVESMIER